MTKNQVAPEKVSKGFKNFVEKAKNKQLKQSVTVHSKTLKPSVSGSRTVFSASSEVQNTIIHAKARDFFLKSTADPESPMNATVKSHIMEQKSKKYSEETKKTFDKKKYRLQKYSKKYKLQQWQERRKHAVLHEYYRQVKDDQPVDVSRIYDDPQNQDSEDDNLEHNRKQPVAESTEINRELKPSKKPKPFERAQQEFQRIKEEKLKKKEDILKNKAEKQETMKKYKKQKVEKYKKLSRRTKKGQPIMKDRIEMLLEKIQSSMK